MRRSIALRFALAAIAAMAVVLSLASRLWKAESETTLASSWSTDMGGIQYFAPSPVLPTSGDSPTTYPSTGVELWDLPQDERLPASVDEQLIANYPSTGVELWDPWVEPSKVQNPLAIAASYDELDGVAIPKLVGRRELIGLYFRGDGTGFDLTLEESGDYECVWTGCFGTCGTSRGRWTVSGNRVSIQVAEETDMMEGKSAKQFDVLEHQGDLILVDADDNAFFLRHGPSRYSCFTRQHVAVNPLNALPIPPRESPASR